LTKVTFMQRVLPALALLTLLGACATEQHAGSGSGRAIALRNEARMYREAQDLLNDTEASIKASKPENAKTSLAEAKAKLASPEMAESAKRGDLEKRAAELEKQITVPVAEQPAVEPAMAASPSGAPSAMPAAVAPAPAKVEQVDPKGALEKAEADLTHARSGLHGHELSKDDVETARTAREALSKALETGRANENNPDYAELAHNGSTLLTESEAEIRLATLIADFVAGPGAAKKQAATLVDQAKALKDAKKRAKAQSEARAALQTCVDDSKKMMTENPVLTRTALFLSAERTSPTKVASACAAQMKKLGGKSVAKK
jgi:hypothetical protein